MRPISIESTLLLFVLIQYFLVETYCIYRINLDLMYPIVNKKKTKTKIKTMSHDLSSYASLSVNAYTF